MGRELVAGEPPELLAELVELCGRLPLAIRIAAARLRAHPAWHLSHLLERLRDQQQLLGELTVGQRSVTAALDLSYRYLNPREQRAYQLLGLHPGHDFDAHATAALLDSGLRDASLVLDQLLEAHLVQEHRPGRHQLHDLTRAHAAYIATRDMTEAARSGAVSRLLNYYLHTASVARDLAYPYEPQRRPQVPAVLPLDATNSPERERHRSIPSARTPIPDLPDAASALQWLDTELPQLLAIARYASEHNWSAHVHHLARLLHRHMVSRGRYSDAEALHHHALAAAREVGDQVAELDALAGLGRTRWLQGRHEEAADYYGRALQLARDTGNHPGELRALVSLGDIYGRQGRDAQAIDHYDRRCGLPAPSETAPASQPHSCHRVTDVADLVKGLA